MRVVPVVYPRLDAFRCGRLGPDLLDIFQEAAHWVISGFERRHHEHVTSVEWDAKLLPWAGASATSNARHKRPVWRSIRRSAHRYVGRNPLQPRLFHDAAKGRGGYCRSSSPKSAATNPSQQRRQSSPERGIDRPSRGSQVIGEIRDQAPDQHAQRCRCFVSGCRRTTGAG